MTDDAEPKPNACGAEDTPSPRASMESQNQSEAQEINSVSASPASKGNRALSFLRELNTNERVTVFLASSSLMVALGSLAIAYLTYRTASDTTDIKGAVGGLTILAQQTKRQADAMSGQLNLLRQQLAEQKKQTIAIIEQTGALKSNAAAAVKSADAEQRAAEVTSISQSPKITLSMLDFAGFARNSDGTMRMQIQYTFENVGGSPISVTNARIFAQAERLPKIANFKGAKTFEGLGLTLFPHTGFAKGNPISFPIEEKITTEISAGKVPVFAYGDFTYNDQRGNQRRFCFAARYSMNPEGLFFRPVRYPALKCE